jgi:hypothetical protein
MTDSRLPIGYQREEALLTHLAEMRDLVGEFRDQLPNVNDQSLRPLAAAVVETASMMFAVHDRGPKPSIADDLAGLMSAVRALRIPARDPDLGRTLTLDRLRAQKGLLIAGLADALDAAAAIGLRPQRPPIPEELVAALPRSEIESLLQGIMRRLSVVEDSLTSLESTESAATEFVQQTGLVNFYTGAMRVQVDLAKLHLAVGERTVDFNALARAVEEMASLTRDFVSTVREWTGRVAAEVVRVASKMPAQVRRVARGVKTTVTHVVRLVRRRRAAGRNKEPDKAQEKLDVAEAVAGLGDPPKDFDLDQVRDMVLRGEEPPASWRPHVRELGFLGTQLAQLTPLAGLASLETLYLEGTQVSDLAPLAGLASLEGLYLQGTQVSDLAPLAGLANLQWLDLQGTQVSDLAPLAGLANLQSLYLEGTQVSDLAPVRRVRLVLAPDGRELRRS